MRIKNNKMIKRKTTIRIDQTCSVCLGAIIRGSDVWVISNLRGKNRKYYHIECGDNINEF
jgi:hypothetical protein